MSPKSKKPPETKRSRGRPRLDDARRIVFRIRFSEAEHAAMLRAAARIGVALPEWVRATLDAATK